MDFDELLQLQVLKRKAQRTGRGPLMEKYIEGPESEALPLRQMCAKVSSELYDDLETMCGLLDMSKREFIEAAVSDALHRAHETIDKVGGFDALFGPIGKGDQ